MRHVSDGVVSGVGRKWKRSASSDSDSGIGTLFSLDHKLYASDYDYDSDSIASENQPLETLTVLEFFVKANSAQG